jgi:transposase InsO family protein
VSGPGGLGLGVLRLVLPAPLRPLPPRRRPQAGHRPDPPGLPGDLRSSPDPCRAPLPGHPVLRQAGRPADARNRHPGHPRGRRRRGLTRRRPGVAPHPDLVSRRFSAPEPDRLWVADITYVPTGEGWLYLATILDCCFRRIVGWSMASHLRSELVVDALEMATSLRRPAPGWSTTPTRVRSTSPWRSPAGWRRPGSRGRWAVWGRLSTTPRPRASSPRSSVSWSTGTASRPVPRPGRRSSSSSRSSTTVGVSTSSLGYLSPAAWESAFHKESAEATVA